MDKYRPGSSAVWLLVSLAVGSLAACGGGDDGSDKVSAASLKNRLLPASALPGFRQQRTFDWGDPVNLVGEGLLLPEATHPSSGVKLFRGRWFRRGRRRASHNRHAA